MKQTDKDLELFKALSKSSLGKDLSDYCSRLMGHVCDSRNWGDNDTKESALQAAQAIDIHIKKKLSPQGRAQGEMINEAE